MPTSLDSLTVVYGMSPPYSFRSCLNSLQKPLVCPLTTLDSRYFSALALDVLRDLE
jgi:hypothetical protein